MMACVDRYSQLNRRLTGLAMCVAVLAGMALLLTSPTANRAREPAPSKETAIARIETAGGFVGIDGELPDQPVWKVELNELPLSKELLGTLKAFPKLEMLSLDKTALTDNLLPAVGELKSLKELSLADTQVTDAGLKHLQGLRALQRLSLHGTAITDKGLLQLASLKTLNEILCVDTAVTEAGLAAFRQAQKTQPDRPDIPVVETAVPSTTMTALEQAQRPLAESLHQLGRALFPAAGQDPDRQRQAVAVLEQSHVAQPDDDLIRLDLADAYVQLGTETSLTLAIDLYEKSLQQQPGDDALLARLADAYGRLGNTDAAFALAALRVRRTEGDPFSAAYQIADFAAETGDVERGIAGLQAVVSTHPSSAASKLLLATLLQEAKQSDAAAELITEVLSELPADSPLAVAARRLQAGENQ